MFQELHQWKGGSFEEGGGEDGVVVGGGRAGSLRVQMRLFVAIFNSSWPGQGS